MRLAWQFVAAGVKRVTAPPEPVRPKKPVVALGAAAAAGPKAAQVPGGKSIKQLMREAKRAEGGSEASDQHDSPLFVAAFRGHGGAVLSASLSADDGAVLTACDDQV